MGNAGQLLGSRMETSEDTGMGTRWREARGLAKEQQAKEGLGYDDTEGGGPRGHSHGQTVRHMNRTS